jgi:hypothetical protein
MIVVSETESPSGETAARTPQFAALTRAQLPPAPAGSAARRVGPVSVDAIYGFSSHPAILYVSDVVVTAPL